MLVARGQVEEAIGHFRKAVEIKPDYLAVRFNLGVALGDCGQLEGAVGQLQKTLDLASTQNEKGLARRHPGADQALPLRGGFGQRGIGAETWEEGKWAKGRWMGLASSSFSPSSFFCRKSV